MANCVIVKPFEIRSIPVYLSSIAPHQLSVSKRESNDQDSLAGANEEDDDVMADYMDSNDSVYLKIMLPPSTPTPLRHIFEMSIKLSWFCTWVHSCY